MTRSRLSTVLPALVVLAASRGVAAQQAAASPTDSLGSGATLTGKTLRHLPVDDVRQALGLLPGVVFRGSSLGLPDAADFSVRGSPFGDVAVYVDGAPARFELLGGQALSLGANALDGVTLTTGVPGVALADARGGVIEYLTRGGDSVFAAEVRAHTDEPFGAGSSVGFNRFEGSAGGPLGAGGRFSWFASGTLQGQRGQYLGWGAAEQPSYTLGGADTTVGAVTLPRFDQVTGLARPYDWSTLTRGQAKLRYRYGEGSSVSLTALGSVVQRRFSPGQFLADPALYQGGWVSSRLAVLHWTQVLRAEGEGGLRIGVSLSYGTDREIGGLLDPNSEAGTRDPSLGVELSSLRFIGQDSIPYPLTNQIIRNIRSNSGLRVPFLNQNSLRNAQPYRLNPYGMLSGWPSTGMDGSLTMARERRLNGRGTIDWTHGHHQVTLGVDATRTDLSYYASPLITQIEMDALLAHPRRSGLFAGDHLTLGRAVLEAGARYDHYSPGALFANVPGRIFTDPTWNNNAGIDDTAYAGSLARVMTPGRGQGFLSPRLRMAFALSDRTMVRAAVGQTVVTPSYHQLLVGTNSDLSFTDVSQPFGRDVDYVKSTMIELGARQSLGARADVDLTAYHKTRFSPYLFMILPYDDPANPGRTINLNSLASVGGNAKGIEARFDWHGGQVLNATATYSLVHTHGDSLGGFTSPRSVTQHQVAAVGTLRAPSGWSWAGGATAYLALRLTSGLPFNQSGDRFPWTKTIDLRLEKRVVAGGVAWTVYGDVRNLLNFHNQIGGYAATGSDQNPTLRAQVLAPEFTNLANEAQSQGMLNGDGSINLADCTQWNGSATETINCVALQRVERRFGDGDHVYTVAEQARALSAYYDAFFGAWTFHGPARTLRVGLELAF